MKEMYEVQSIGKVVSQYKNLKDRCDYQNDINEIHIYDYFADGLLGTEFFSHFFCVYYQHRREEWKSMNGLNKDEQPLKLPLTREPTCRGIFSKRSPARPAGMGSCVINLVKREGTKLFVKGLDAIDGTPILDLKVYIPQFDAFPMATAPMHWCLSQTEYMHSARSFHWDTVNVTMTLGMRAGIKALQMLDISRGEAVKAKVIGSTFFAHGVEVVTGCSILKSSLELKETEAKGEKWVLELFSKNKKVLLIVRDGMYSGADEVLIQDDLVLFGDVIID